MTTTTPQALTCLLHSGEEVLAKEYKGEAAHAEGELCAKTYANPRAAAFVAARLGADWTVIHRGRPWYVARVPAPEQADNECDDCGKRWPDSKLREVDKLFERVDPGGVMPSGECPECGALCYPIETDFTVVTLCRCGCDSPAVIHHVTAADDTQAREKAIEGSAKDAASREHIDVVCVLRGRCEEAV